MMDERSRFAPAALYHECWREGPVAFQPPAPFSLELVVIWNLPLPPKWLCGLKGECLS